ncbi:helix-turn-helix transcriptional regulator [Fulvivirga sp. 29W222]|uniref:Helix-turn-helix transcriptional regulator n=1 Tax=Fulvivirga marina TaxID=2494733 RepID=A0A937G0A2_9BACT|nr:helix-turn-helix transcriptional regulator [Fulvivirga marina]MBL6448282.1 helix-turn-helix transcriptional regulator [Fulvivirga marina]
MKIEIIHAAMGEKISYFRTKLGLSQVELAERLQESTGELCDRHAVSRFENGHRKLPVNYVPILAQIFGITTDELFYSAEQLRKTNKDPFGTQVADYRQLAEDNPKEAANKALEALLQAKNEVQALKEQLRKCEEELKKKTTLVKKYVALSKMLNKLQEEDQ